MLSQIFFFNRCSKINSGAFWGYYTARYSFIWVVKESWGGGGGGCLAEVASARISVLYHESTNLSYTITNLEKS